MARECYQEQREGYEPDVCQHELAVLPDDAAQQDSLDDAKVVEWGRLFNVAK